VTTTAMASQAGKRARRAGSEVRGDRGAAVAGTTGNSGPRRHRRVRLSGVLRVLRGRPWWCRVFGVGAGRPPLGFPGAVLGPITAGGTQEGWLARTVRARDRAPCPMLAGRTNLGVSHFQALSHANSATDA